MGCSKGQWSSNTVGLCQFDCAENEAMEYEFGILTSFDKTTSFLIASP